MIGMRWIVQNECYGEFPFVVEDWATGELLPKATRYGQTNPSPRRFKTLEAAQKVADRLNEKTDR